MSKKKNANGRPRNCKSCKRPKTQCKCGATPKITPEKLQILTQAFADGATNEQAVMIANISVRTLYNYFDKNPEFLQMREGVRGMLRYKAKRNLRKSLDGAKMGDKQMSDSWEVLKTTDPEYKPNAEGGSTNTGTQILIDNRNLNPRLKTDEELLQIASGKK